MGSSGVWPTPPLASSSGSSPSARVRSPAGGSSDRLSPPHGVMQVTAGVPLGLALHRDPVALAVGQVREAVVPIDRLAIDGELDADVLARSEEHTSELQSRPH